MGYVISNQQEGSQNIGNNIRMDTSLNNINDDGDEVEEEDEDMSAIVAQVHEEG